ncbi:MAG: zinc-binding alcohol dehydrogenase family protein [bacterium]
MKSVVCHAPHQISVELRPVEPPGEGEVTLRLSRFGICGTDYHIFSGQHPFLNYPRVIGHELSGVIITSPAGSGWQIGEMVAVNPYIACGSCHACQIGKPNCCMKIAVLGVHRDGGMAEFLNLPVQNLIRADGLTADQAASVEFLAIGAHAVRRSGLGPGARVLVVGAGPIGIGAALFARVAGGRVTIVDRDPQRLRLVSEATGIADLMLADENIATAVAQATAGDGFDVVFDATGNQASMEASFAHVAHGGVMVLVGLLKARISFDDPEFHRREMSLMASRNATQADFDHVIAAIRGGQVDVGRLITHRTTLAKVAEDLPFWAADKTGLIKAMVELA